MKIGFFDTEVKESPEKTGWKNYKAMGLSVGCIVEREVKNKNNRIIISSTKEHIFVDDAKGLADKLNKMDLVVGFNNKNFDDNLICELADKDQKFLLNNFDIQEYLDNKTNIKYCTNLNSLSKNTINRGKTEGIDGSKAPELWKNYKENDSKKSLKLLKKYCLNDCYITADIFLFGAMFNYVLIRPNKNEDLFGNMVLRIEVDWKKIISSEVPKKNDKKQ